MLNKSKQRYIPSKAEKRVLDIIMRKGGMSQSKLAEHTGTTQQYLSRVLKNLQDEGLLRKGERIASGGRGQPGTSIELVPDFIYSLGACLISDTLSIALIDFQGNVLEEMSSPMTSMKRGDIFMKLRSTIDDFKHSQNIHEQDIAGLGIGISGYSTGAPGTFNPTPPLNDWALINLEELFIKELGIPTWAENDGNVAALGENMRGVGRWANNFAYIHLTYGFGGGIIIDGKLMPGRKRNAGEFGGTVPYSHYKISLESLRKEINAFGLNIENVSALVRNFDINWPGVEEWIFYTRETLFQIFRSTAAILDPDVIVFGGQIPKELAERLIEETKPMEPSRRGMTISRPKVVISESIGDPGATGAAILPLKNQYFE